jgi:hypothetical protein
MYSGISYFYDELYVLSGETRKRWVQVICDTYDFRNKIKHYTSLMALEMGARYTLTDNLDGSNRRMKVWNHYNLDINNNDWYVFQGH